MLFPKIKPYLYAIISTIFWGSSFSIIKSALNSSSPILFAFLRYLFATFLFLTVIKHDFVFKWQFALIGAIGISFPVILQNIALQYTSAYISGFIQSTGPIYTLIFAITFLKERFTWNKIAGILVAFISTYFLIHGYGKNEFAGSVLLLLSAVFYSAGGIISKKMINDGYNSINVISYATIFASIFLFPPIFFEKMEIDVAGIEYALILAIFATFFASLLWYKAMEKMEISRLTCFVYLIPFFSLIFSWLLLQEEIDLIKMVYGIFIIIGVAIAEA